MKKKSQAPPRPYAPQFVPLDYKGEIPKFSQGEVAKIAQREGQVLKAHGVTMTATKAEQFQARRMIEPPPAKKEAPQANRAQAPPQAEKPAPTTPAQAQQKQGYQFSEKAKAFFAKYSKTKEQPQKEQEQTKTKPKEKDRER